MLLDKNNHHIFQPLLYQVATAGIEPSAISFPYRKIFKKRKHFHIRICEAQRVIPEDNILETSIGALSYDYLVSLPDVVPTILVMMGCLNGQWP